MWKTFGAIAEKYRDIPAFTSGSSSATISLQGLFLTSGDA